VSPVYDDAKSRLPCKTVQFCCGSGECVQRSCSDLRSAERLKSANSDCDRRDLIVPRLQSSAACWSLDRRSTATPAAVVEILRTPPRSPSDHAGPPWTDTTVRRTKDVSLVSRRTHSFPVDGDPQSCQPLATTTTTTTRGDELHRKCRRRHSAASSPTSQDLDAHSAASTVKSTDHLRGSPRPQISLDYDDDVIDGQMTSEVTSSSPPTVNTTEQQ